MPLPLSIIVPVAIAGLIWLGLYARATGIIGVCLATIVAGSVFGYEFVHVGPVTSDRLLLALVCLMYFMQRSVFGLKARPITASDWGWIVFVGVLTFQTLTGEWSYRENAPLSLLLFYYVMPFALYWVASRCELTEQKHRWILGTLVLMGCYLALTAVCEVKSISALVFPRYIASTEHAEFLGRGRGPFLNPIGNGLYLTVSMFSAIACWPFVRKSHRPIVVAVALLICGGAVCTLTRSVWLGVAFSVLVLACLLVPRQHIARVLLVAMIAGGSALALKGAALSSFKRDKNVSKEAMAESAKLRPILAAFAYEMFWDHPLSGVGLAQYRRYNADYLTSRSFDMPMEKAKQYVQHNMYLSLLVETGLAGVTTFVLAWLINIWGAWRVWSAESLPLWQRQHGLLFLLLACAYLPNSMFHEMSVIPMLNMLVFFVAGLSRNMQEQLRGTPARAYRAEVSPAAVPQGLAAMQ